MQGADELAKVLRLDVDPSTFEPGNVRQKTLAVVLRNALDVNPEKAPAMIEMLKIYLASFDNIGGEFTRMEDYMPFRIANCG